MTTEEFVRSERFQEMRNQLGAMLFELREAFEQAEREYYVVKRQKVSGDEVEDAFEDLAMYHRLFMSVDDAHRLLTTIELAPDFRQAERATEEISLVEEDSQ